MLFRKSFLALSLGLAGVAASAQTTGNVVVTANVVAACNVTVTNLAFGNYDPLAGAAVNGSATASIACSQGAIPVISMGAGANPLVAQRRMALGAAFLNYGLFQPVTNAPGAVCAYTTPWGDGGAFGTALTATAATSLAVRAYNICGQIPAGQNVGVGVYTDTVAVNITF